MVYDGAVKDKESSRDPEASAAVSEAPSAAAAEVVGRARPGRPTHDKRLGVRHPLKHHRFRAGEKMMAEPGGVPSTHAEVVGEEEEASGVEEEESTSAETEMPPPSPDVEVSSSPPPVVPVVEEIPVVEEMEVEGGEMELSPEAALLVDVEDSELVARPEEDDEVSSVAGAQGERKQEPTPAGSEPASEPPKEKDDDKEREGRRKKLREMPVPRERVDEVGYMSGGWKR